MFVFLCLSFASFRAHVNEKKIDYIIFVQLDIVADTLPIYLPHFEWKRWYKWCEKQALRHPNTKKIILYIHLCVNQRVIKEEDVTKKQKCN